MINKDGEALAHLNPKEFGSIPQGFKFVLHKGYTTFIGANDSGKSSILQWIFWKGFGSSEIGPNRVCYLSTERDMTPNNTETQGNTLEKYNRMMFSFMQDTIINNGNPKPGFQVNDLPKLLLTDENLYAQITRLNNFLNELGLPELEPGRGQTLNFNDIALAFHGTGLRSLFYIFSALSNANLDLILIDEPELSLEPLLQKRLKNLLIKESKDRAIIVATHSHLFINSEEPENNFRTNIDQRRTCSITKINDADLSDVVFRLLGNSLEDLFFPNNFLIVEGASDQMIYQKVSDLLSIPSLKVRIVAAGDIVKVSKTYSSIVTNLRPLIANFSPYKDKVVVAVDKPKNLDDSSYVELGKSLGNRLITLTEESLEEYIPEDLYVKAKLNKEDELKKISEETFPKKKGEIKKDISNRIAGILEVADLQKIPEIKRALLLASAESE